MKKVQIDPPIDTILPLKGAHEQVALEYIIKLLNEHDNKMGVQEMTGIYLNYNEFNKVKTEINKVIKQLQKKVNKIKGS